MAALTLYRKLHVAAAAGFVVVLLGQAVAQNSTHRWRDCHQNAKRETVCRECWLAAGFRHCTQPRVAVRMSEDER